MYEGFKLSFVIFKRLFNELKIIKKIYAKVLRFFNIRFPLLERFAKVDKIKTSASLCGHFVQSLKCVWGGAIASSLDKYLKNIFSKQLELGTTQTDVV